MTMQEFSYEIWCNSKMLVRITGIGKQNTRQFAKKWYDHYVARGRRRLELRGPPREKPGPKTSNAELISK
jgi:hypothetical protein